MTTLQPTRSRVKPCTCAAYPFPHRPNGGRCEIRYAVMAAHERLYRWCIEREELEEISRDFNVVDGTEIARTFYNEVLA